MELLEFWEAPVVPIICEAKNKVWSQWHENSMSVKLGPWTRDASDGGPRGSLFKRVANPRSLANLAKLGEN